MTSIIRKHTDEMPPAPAASRPYYYFAHAISIYYYYDEIRAILISDYFSLLRASAETKADSSMTLYTSFSIRFSLMILRANAILVGDATITTYLSAASRVPPRLQAIYF